MIESLPIYPYLESICENLKNSESRFLVLSAETGAGKSTGIPIAMLRHFSGTVLMLEPRRLTTIALAERISELLGEKSGGTVGYRLRFETAVSDKTRLEVITEGIFVRRLQNDSLLEGVSVVVFDEFHERSLYSDVALAFLKETMLLRDDLYVIVMSATINYRSVAEYVGTKEKPAPVMTIPGRTFPIEIFYEDAKSVTDVVCDVVNENSEIRSIKTNGSSYRADSILVFLPGIFEIRRVQSELENRLSECDIRILHSSVPLAEQKSVLEPVPDCVRHRTIVLSSSIAETSLTVPGVSVVVDSGLCRRNRMNVALGMERLATERESMFSANQRAGRAGRVRAGKCIRLWNKNDVLAQETVPEILCSDITQLVLECALWGTCEREKFSWLDAPSENAWNAAVNLLEMLGCVKKNRITEKGKRVSRLGLHPRLACVVLASGVDYAMRFIEQYESDKSAVKAVSAQLKNRLGRMDASDFADESGFPGVLFGFPDRLAVKCAETVDFGEYQFSSGRKAIVRRENCAVASCFPQWIVAIDVDAGEKKGKIRSYEAVDAETARRFVSARSTVRTELELLERFSAGKKVFSVRKTEVTLFGEIVLKQKRIPVEKASAAEDICAYIQKNGIEKLSFDSRINSFLLRAEFCRQRKSAVAGSDKCILELESKLGSLWEKSDEWLKPFVIDGVLSAQTVYDALYWYLDGKKIDSLAPESLVLPNGRKCKVTYEKHSDSVIQPVIEIIVQRLFGCFETPSILGVPVLLKLLSPASRPLQITDDLKQFWSGTWLEICKEMKGRYPKHNWDYRLAEKE